MKTLVIYDSVFGNTELVARAMAYRFAAVTPTEVHAVSEQLPDTLKEVELLVVGCPTQRHGLSPAMHKFLEGIPAGELRGVRAAAFDTRLDKAKWLTGAASGKVGQALKHKGATLIADPESFFVTAREGPLGEDELAQAHIWADYLIEIAGLSTPEVISDRVAITC